MDGINTKDTPIAKLSKIFSFAEIVESSKKSKFPTDYSIEDKFGIPRDIDENANQEPPEINTHINIISSRFSFKNSLSNISQQCSNCSSSGYHSCASNSAPSTCHLDINHENNFFIPKINPFCDSNKNLKNDLIRSQSLNSNWLAKRTRGRPRWPRISGILRRSSTLPVNSSSINDSPVSNEFKDHALSFCPKLSAVGEVFERGLVNEFQSRVETRYLQKLPVISNKLSPQTPVIKKQRMCSQIPLETQISPISTMEIISKIADDTILLDSPTTENFNINEECRKSAPFEFIRHQSTPVAKAKILHSPLISSENVRTKSHLPRCASMPVSVDNERSAFGSDNNLMGERHPAPVLPIIERTGAGLNFVSTETVNLLLKGDYDRAKIVFLLVDCRYPYEYAGGHIKNAVNLFTYNDLVLEIFNRVPARSSGSGPPKILGDELNRRLAIPVQENPLPEFNDYSNSDDSDYMLEQDSDVIEDDSEHQASAQGLRFCFADRQYMENCQSVSSNDSGESSKQLQTSTDSPSKSNEPKYVVIFHCEFSSQRAPNLAIFLRRIDRTTNYNRYPFLFFPEVYVMKGGYSEFFNKFPEQCEPNNYVTMFNREFRAELQLYRRLTKRVMKACQECFRPSEDVCEHSLLEKILPPNSSDQSPPPNQHEISRKSQHFNVALEKKSIASNPVYDQENIAPHLLAIFNQNNQPGDMLSPNLDSVNKMNLQFGSSRSSEHKSDESYSSFESEENRLSRSFEEISLRLAEAVVRVGRRVVAATLQALPREDDGPPLSEHADICGQDRSGIKRPLLDPTISNQDTPISNIIFRPEPMNFSSHSSPFYCTPTFPATRWIL